MPPLALNTAAASHEFADLPESWRVGDFGRFSREKALFDYQRTALTLATRALWLYYEDAGDWESGESEEAKDARKRAFVRKNYGGDLREFNAPEFTDRRRTKANPIFRILERGFAAENGAIPYWRTANRMGFWMATGSGKTLVMIKLAEHLERLKKGGEIPPHPILILAPGGHPLMQIRRAVDEFNRAGGMRIDLAHLREFRGDSGLHFNDTARVYYCDANHFSEEQKEAMVDYRAYENGGKWLVMLDEAHRGRREDAKRKAMYSLMARDGFLFNFSATFTDADDIAAAVICHNLPDFVRAGHGKRLHMHDAEFSAFRDANPDLDIGEAAKKKITLKSLSVLALLKRRVLEVRKKSGLGDSFYHLPLMLTLVNSVNVDRDRNDLFQFFQTLRELASGDIDAAALKEAANELAREWRDPKGELFAGRHHPDPPLCGQENPFKDLTAAALREAVFLGKKPGELEYQTGRDGKEIAFKLKSADAPFGLIRIGDIKNWTKDFLEGMEGVKALAEKPFFSRLDESPMTMLMGSRAFFESWDSNRPNIINFINIGGRDARIFVPQSVGRGARIEPLPGRRRRLDRLLPSLPDDERSAAEKVRGETTPLETLFLFATNRAAMTAVLKGMNEGNVASEFRPLGDAFKARTRTAEEGPLLVPCYKKDENGEANSYPFYASEDSLSRFRRHMADCPDSVLLVRDGFSPRQTTQIRAAAESDEGVEEAGQNNYADISLMTRRMATHFASGGLGRAKVRELKEGANGDIVHFRRISARLSTDDDMLILKAKIEEAVNFKDKSPKLLDLVDKGALSREDYRRLATADFQGRLEIRHCASHYYSPLAMAVDGRADWIRHVVREKSEVQFLRALENWLAQDPKIGWDFWMFSKLDEATDSVYIPYQDTARNQQRKFKPDFVFWMRRRGEYRVVFADPKGAVFPGWRDKAKGWERLFADKTFSHESVKNICVRLAFYAKDRTVIPGGDDGNSWIDHPAAIFADD